MTISTTYDREFTVIEICKRAAQKAGLLNARQPFTSTHPLAQQALDFLEMELDSLQADGRLINTTVQATLDLVASTGSYELPADTLDVVGTPMVFQGSTVSTPVELMSQDDYDRMPDKTSEGTPRRLYVQRLLTVSVFLWPIPPSTASGWTLTYRKVRFLFDADEGGNTLDLARYWVKYLVAQIAHELALSNGIPIPRVGYLAGQAEKAKERALAYNRPRGPIQIHSAHRGGGFQ